MWPAAAAPCTVRARKISGSLSAFPTDPYAEPTGRKPVLTPDRPAGAAISISTGARPRTRTCSVPPRVTEPVVTVSVARPTESVIAVSGVPMPPLRSTGSPDTGLPSESVTAATMVAVESVPRNAM